MQGFGAHVLWLLCLAVAATVHSAPAAAAPSTMS